MSASSNDRDRIWSFQRREYWDSRYKEQLVEGSRGWPERPTVDQTFDWLCTYESVRGYVDQYIVNAVHALDIGCGNAAFAAAVCRAHPRLALTGIDYSKLLFDACGTSLGPSARCGWLVMNARRMAFRAGSFDVVLDKGCLDALCAGSDQIAVLRGWGRTISEEEEELTAAASVSVAELLREVDRCLAPGGRYICISYEGPPGRQHLFASAAEAGLSLRLVQTVLEEESHNYVYILVKGKEEQDSEAAAAAVAGVISSE